MSVYLKSFTKPLIDWARNYYKPMPWSGVRDPYSIWLSEIILQQTRLQQGTPYYLKFIETFPSICDLAQAPLDQVMALWQGLGYYSRCRNLHTTAQEICFEHKGIFPSGYNEILKLKGIGPYTAAAISSFAFNHLHAVVDGNVYRVLARYFGISTPIDSTPGKKHFHALANQLIDQNDPGIYNQGIMNLGADICKPGKPDCSQCPLQKNCIANHNNTWREFPVRNKKIKRKSRYLNFMVFKNGDYYFIEKRTGRDIWQSLYQFPLIESDRILTASDIISSEPKNEWSEKIKGRIIRYPDIFTQSLTHQDIVAAFFEIDSVPGNGNGLKGVITGNLDNFAFPKIIVDYLKCIT